MLDILPPITGEYSSCSITLTRLRLLCEALGVNQLHPRSLVERHVLQVFLDMLQFH